MVHKKDFFKSFIKTIREFLYSIMLIFSLLFGIMLFYWGLFKLESFETIGLIIVVIIFFLIIWKGNYDNINYHL